MELVSLPTSTATPFQVSASAPAPTATIFIGNGESTELLFGVGTLVKLHLVLHPVGNIAEHLVSAGLARIVDWHAGMLAAGGKMERLRQAERSAKEKRLGLFANIAAPPIKANGAVAANGGPRHFDAVVIRVWSGDQISVAEKDGSKERRIQLSSVRAPKYILVIVFHSPSADGDMIQVVRSKTDALRKRSPRVPS